MNFYEPFNAGLKIIHTTQVSVKLSKLNTQYSYLGMKEPSYKNKILKTIFFKLNYVK